MSKLEEEFERTLPEKITHCKRNNGNLDALLFEEYNRGKLEKDLVPNAEKAAGYPEGKIAKYLRSRTRQDKLISIERYNIYVGRKFRQIVSKVEAGSKIENETFFKKYELNTK